MMVIHLYCWLHPANGTESTLSIGEFLDLVSPNPVFLAQMIVAAAARLANTLSTPSIVAFLAVRTEAGRRGTIARKIRLRLLKSTVSTLKHQAATHPDA